MTVIVEISEEPCCMPADPTEELSPKVGCEIVKATEAVGENGPSLPTIVTLYVPGTALALAENCKIHVPVVVIGLGLNVAVTPLGKPDAEKFMDPAPICTKSAVS